MLHPPPIFPNHYFVNAKRKNWESKKKLHLLIIVKNKYLKNRQD